MTEVKKLQPTTSATHRRHPSALGTSKTATMTRSTRNHITTSTNDMTIPLPNVGIYRNSSSQNIIRGRSKTKDQDEQSYDKNKTRTTRPMIHNRLTRTIEQDRSAHTPIRH